MNQEWEFCRGPKGKLNFYEKDGYALAKSELMK